MEPEKLLEALHTAEKLKDTTRHCYTSKGRHESVAEHSWRIALMAFWLRDEFPQADMDKVIRMCLIHDLGECFTGDIPAFDKTAADEAAEEALLSRWVDSLPEPVCTEMRTLYAEMAALQTTEAKIYKALDKMEAIVQHNESAIATWEQQEYALNLTYGVEQSPSHKVKEFRMDAVVCENKDGAEVTIPCDYIVLAMGARSNEFDAAALEAASIPVYSIGDAAGKAADISNAIRTGYDTACQL